MTIDNQGGNKPDPKVGAAAQGGPKKAMTAIIAVLVVIIVVMSVLYLTKGPAAAPSVTQSVTGDLSATAGVPYNISINVGTSFKSVQVSFGDGSSVVVPYSNSDFVNVSHIYTNPGQAIISYSVTYNNGATKVAETKLTPVKVLASATSVSDQQSLGLVNYNYANSSTSIASGQPIFKVGSFVNFTVGYFGEPKNTSYQIVWQNVTVGYGSGKIYTFGYTWNSGQQAYVESSTVPNLNFTFNQAGVYSVDVITYTAAVNDITGAIESNLYSTTYFYNVAIFNNGGVSSTTNGGSFTYVTSTPYDTLDPAISYGVNGYQIMLATYQTLVTYNGSSSSQFVPELASQLPTTGNGGINQDYNNYTKSYINGTGNTVTYIVNLTPYENYTFHIRSNATWQDGTPVTAWDVMYSITRSMLFDQGSPGTPGWITAQYLLPGDYYSSNTFYNITQNLTVNNSTNNITFHFQVPMSPQLVFNLFSAIGSQIADASWLQAHGAGITWNSTGFQEYKSQGLLANYNQYVQNHAFSDGPFKIEYIVPSSEVVMVPNPAYNPPGPWFPKTTLNKVVLVYTSQVSSMQLMLQSGEANSAAIPSSSWAGVQSLQSNNKANVYNYTMLGIYYYSFNFNVNASALKPYESSQGYNMPTNLFTNLSVRKAFSYTYNYNYYLDNQVGNKIFNMNFAQRYAGVLAQGMLGYQSISDLNNTTNGVPYFNLQIAKNYWNSFVNNSAFNAPGGNKMISWDSAKNAFVYNGKPLVIPIAIFSGIPEVVAGETTWASELSQVILGAQFPAIVLSANTIVNLAGHDSNPWPIWFSTWYPDYPYPSDYLGPLAEPLNGTFIPGPQDFNPAFLTATGHVNQASNATQMIDWFNLGSQSYNTSQDLVYFHKMNEMLVNMTTQVYIEQLNGFWVMAPNVNGTMVQQYQSNLMFASGGDILLNLIRLNPSS